MRDNKDAYIVVRVSKKYLKLLDEVIAKNPGLGRSRSEVIRTLVNTFFDDYAEDLKSENPVWNKVGLK